MALRIVNRSGYSTEDLRAFFRRGLRACAVRGNVTVRVTASPIRSRGCAEIRGREMSIALAAPSNASQKEFVRRLARLFEHEAGHLRGLEHRQMPKPLLFSKGGTPPWARGMRIRYLGRAPNQMRELR